MKNLHIDGVGYLRNNKKLVIVQIGNHIFKLKDCGSIKNGGHLKDILNTYDVRLLKDGG